MHLCSYLRSRAWTGIHIDEFEAFTVPNLGYRIHITAESSLRNAIINRSCIEADWYSIGMLDCKFTGFYEPFCTQSAVFPSRIPTQVPWMITTVSTHSSAFVCCNKYIKKVHWVTSLFVYPLQNAPGFTLVIQLFYFDKKYIFYLLPILMFTI